MVAAFGQLAALQELGLLRNVRYISGISGGSWATHAFTYYQPSFPGVAQNDTQFLCLPLTAPANLTTELLAKMEPTCSRSLATKVKNQTVTGGDPVSDGAIAVNWAYALKRMGIPLHGFFSLSAEVVQAIVQRNPNLQAKDFLLPSANMSEHPFPIVGTAVMGPYRLSPFTKNHRAVQVQMLEVTPLYIGQSLTSVQQYVSARRNAPEPHALTLGGYIEPFAFGGMAAPDKGLPANVTQGVLDVPRVAVPFSLANATFASSFFAGMVLSLLPLVDDAAHLLTGYWSPSSPSPRSDQMMLMDGGCFENVHLIGLLKRRVKNIVLFINTVQPMHSRIKWDPRKRPPTSSEFDDMVPWFFGVPVAPGDEKERLEQETSFDYSQNQVFNSSEFVGLATALQDKQAIGQAPVVTTPLVTIANPHWGVPPGISTNVTWVYLSRVGEWEDRLDENLRKLVRPEPFGVQVTDYGEEIKSGPFESFPSYSTDEGVWSPAKANLLAELTGWAVTSQADIFRAALG